MAQQRYRRQRNWGARIHEVDLRGMRMVILENETLRVGILVDKGTDIIEWCYKPQDMDFVWLSADGVRNPTDYLATAPDPAATFLDYYPGGWQEVFPNGGAPSLVAGAPYGQHGEVCQLPWDYTILEDSAEGVTLRCTVRTQRAPYLLQKTLRLTRQAPTLFIEEDAVNDSAVPLAAMWGQHITFGAPFLTPGCRIHLPDAVTVTPHPDDGLFPHGRRVAAATTYQWPSVRDPAGAELDLREVPPPGTPSELLYLSGFTQGWYMVENPAHHLGLRLTWDVQVMPYLWFWQEYGASTAYPWYGRHYNIGLEPFSSYPTNGVAGAIANGSALTMGPHAVQRFAFRAEVILAP
jgi:hypothetical protein